METATHSVEGRKAHEQDASTALAGTETGEILGPASQISGEKEPVELLPWLPCTLVLEVPVVKFSVGTLLSLRSGKFVETAWHQSTDIPMRVNGLLMAWTEFEVVGERLAARITDLV